MRNRFAVRFGARALAVVFAGAVVLSAVGWAQAATGQAPAPTAQSGPAAQSAVPTLSPTGGDKDGARAAFDVATIKPAAQMDAMKMAQDMQAGKMPRMGARVEGLSANYYYTTVKELIAAAYKVKDYQVSGPAWLETERFDVEARMPEGSTKDDAPKMLQALLAERFKLVAHKETAEHPVLALVVGKDGPKLQVSPPDVPVADDDTPLKKGEMKIAGPDGPMRVTSSPDGTSTINMGSRGVVKQRLDMSTMSLHLDSSKLTMAGFADMLTNLMTMGGGSGKQVVDMTNLQGNYQVAVDISMASLLQVARQAGVDIPPEAASAITGGTATAGEASDPGGGGATIYASVQKLGLKLEQRKAPVEQVVVDSMEKTPTEN